MEKLSPEIIKHRLDHINHRWTQLYELEKEWGERSLKYLMLTNSGGAIATLSFLGASDMTLKMLPVKIALFCFIFGIVLVGASTAKEFHHMSKLFKSWKIDVEEHFKNNINWDQLNNNDNSRTGADFIDYALPYTSFACFVLGCVSGGFALFNNCV